jgi:hypothetical protein
MTPSAAQNLLSRGASDVVTLDASTPEDAMPAFELLLSPSQTRRLRALLCEEFERIEWYRKTTERARVGYHGMLDDAQSDLHAVYEQLVCARAGALAVV